MKIWTPKDLLYYIAISFCIKFVLLFPLWPIVAICTFILFVFCLMFSKNNTISMSMTFTTSKISIWVIYICIFPLATFIGLTSFFLDEFQHATSLQQFLFFIGIPFWVISTILDVKIAKHGWLLDEQEPPQPEKTLLADEKEKATSLFSTSITPLFDAILTKNIDSVKIILQDHPEHLNTAYAQNGNTPLHVAALNGYTEIVRLLLEQPGIDTTRKNNDGKTALDLAQEKGFAEIAGLLQ